MSSRKRKGYEGRQRRKSKHNKYQKTGNGYSGGDMTRTEAMDILNTRTAGFLGIENKFLDTARQDIVVDQNLWRSVNPDVGLGCLSAPVQGTGESERNGRMYTIDSIFVHGLWHSTGVINSAVSQSEKRARIIVYWDRQTNAAQIGPGIIVKEGGVDNILAFRNLQNTKRVVVLFDKTVTFKNDNQMIQPNGQYSIGARDIPFNFYKKFRKGITVQTDGTTGTVASITDNCIGMIACAEGVTIRLTYQARMRFRG